MPHHSSPTAPFFVPGARPPIIAEQSTNPATASEDRFTNGRHPTRGRPLQSGAVFAAMVAGAASVGLPAVDALLDGWSDPAETTATALAAVRTEASSPGPDVATSQVLSIPVVDGQRSSAEARGDIQALRKANDRRVSNQRRADERRPDSPGGRDAQQAVAGGFARPVAGRVTSSYGSRSGGTHYGLDVANRVGTPIRAAAEGTVISAGPASGFGLWVRVRHDDGTVTVYGHINKALVEVGQQVGAGELIAEVGNRGQSTGPHLHFEAHSASGKKLDPGRWLDQRGVGF